MSRKRLIAVSLAAATLVAATAIPAFATNVNPCNADGKMNTTWDDAATKVVNAGCPVIKVQGAFVAHAGAIYYVTRTKSNPVSGAGYYTYITDGEVFKWRGCSSLTSGATNCYAYSSWFTQTAWYTYPGW